MQTKHKIEIGNLTAKFVAGTLSQKTFKEKMTKIQKSLKIKMDIDMVTSTLSKEKRSGNNKNDCAWIN